MVQQVPLDDHPGLHIVGPLIIGSCILNRPLQFIRDRLSITQALVLTQQYRAQHTIDSLP